MKNETHTRYRVTWKSDTQRTRKEAQFALLKIAEEYYEEKLAEGKNPQLWKQETTVTFEEIHLQRGQLTDD